MANATDLTNSKLLAPTFTISLLVIAGLLTIALLQRHRLRRLRRQLKDSQQVTQRFTDLLSHELRNPMNAINGHLDLLEASNQPSDNNKHIHQIRNASRVLIDQLDDILSVAVGFGDDEPAQIECFAVTNLCRDVVDEFDHSPTSHSGKTDITLTFDERLPSTVLGPRKAIRIALRHLVSNALRYGHGKSVSIEVSYRGTATGVMDGMLAIRVRDQGSGVTSDISQSLFRLFSHLRATDHADPGQTPEAQQGIGRGLPISKQVIERCGGRIGFLSRPNHGSVFWLRIPVQATADEPIASKTTKKDNAPAAISNRATQQPADLRLTIVDDLPSRADIFAEYLALLLPEGCNIIDRMSRDEILAKQALSPAMYLIASDCFAQLPDNQQQAILDQPSLVLDYGHSEGSKVPDTRLVGPYDPDLLSRLDGMADNAPIRHLIAQANS